MAASIPGTVVLTDQSFDNEALDLDCETHIPLSQLTGGQNGVAEIKSATREILSDADDEVIFEDLTEESLSKCALEVLRIQKALSRTFKRNLEWLQVIFRVLLLLGFLSLCGYAMYRDFKRSIPLLVFVSCFGLFLGLYGIRQLCGAKIQKCFRALAVNESFKTFTTVFKGVVITVLTASMIFLVVYLNVDTPSNLMSVVGIFVYCLLLYLFSYNPARVQWRAVFGGLFLQFLFALIILRTRWGFDSFAFLGKQMEIFFTYSDTGAIFVFGDSYKMHFFAFKVLPVVIFFSATISVLYYLGVMQCIIKYVALVMQFVMGTTSGESLSAAGNIFVGQTEAPLLIRPIIKTLTRSEIHAVMTGGFATIAGSVMATYILFGVPANHLLSASVMSAPAALAMAKLFYPETQKSKTRAGEYRMDMPVEHNVVQALSNGAVIAVSLVANIAGNLIAFLAVLDFMNAVLTWFGGLIGLEPALYEPLTFQFICSYLLWPFAFLMGADAADCRQVATLLGIKTFLNEFVAYEDLSVLIKNRVAYNAYMVATNGSGLVDTQLNNLVLVGTGETLVGGIMSARSEVIATYALCGFANFGSIGIMLGGLGPLAPSRRGDMAKVVIRAMIAGTVACFLTACIAGLLYDPHLET